MSQQAQPTRSQGQTPGSQNEQPNRDQQPQPPGRQQGQDEEE